MFNTFLLHSEIFRVILQSLDKMYLYPEIDSLKPTQMEHY